MGFSFSFVQQRNESMSYHRNSSSSAFFSSLPLGLSFFLRKMDWKMNINLSQKASADRKRKETEKKKKMEREKAENACGVLGAHLMGISPIVATISNVSCLRVACVSYTTITSCLHSHRQIVAINTALPPSPPSTWPSDSFSSCCQRPSRLAGPRSFDHAGPRVMSLSSAQTSNWSALVLVVQSSFCGAWRVQQVYAHSATSYLRWFVYFTRF